MTEPTKKPLQSLIPSIIFILAVCILVLSVYFIYNGFAIFQSGSTDYLSQFATGIFGIVTSIYILTRFMKRFHAPQKPLSPNMVTVVESKKCGFKQIRKFIIDDYILKSVENCPKCNEPMLITGIYAEEIKKKAN
jgi:hypothetical protein